MVESRHDGSRPERSAAFLVSITGSSMWNLVVFDMLSANATRKVEL